MGLELEGPACRASVSGVRAGCPSAGGGDSRRALATSMTSSRWRFTRPRAPRGGSAAERSQSLGRRLYGPSHTPEGSRSAEFPDRTGLSSRRRWFVGSWRFMDVRVSHEGREAWVTDQTVGHNYEFSPQQDAVFQRLAGAMTFIGAAMMVPGVVLLVVPAYLLFTHGPSVAEGLLAVLGIVTDRDGRQFIWSGPTLQADRHDRGTRYREPDDGHGRSRSRLCGPAMALDRLGRGAHRRDRDGLDGAVTPTRSPSRPDRPHAVYRLWARRPVPTTCSYAKWAAR
jgi:hypothetical protein